MSKAASRILQGEMHNAHKGLAQTIRRERPDAFPSDASNVFISYQRILNPAVPLIV